LRKRTPVTMGITIGIITTAIIGGITGINGITGTTGIIVGGRMATGIATGRVTPQARSISEATAAYPGRNHSGIKPQPKPQGASPVAFFFRRRSINANAYFRDCPTDCWLI
jgi:hypothetical protein